MGDPAKRRATYQDVLDAPPDVVAEVIDGRLYTHARPRVRHSRAASRLAARLGPPFDEGIGGPGGWILLLEPELHLGPDPDILVPDYAGWRRETLPELPDDLYISVAPDWVCEVLSPATEDVDRAEKLPVYAREGVRHVWLLDPAVRTLEVLRLDGESYRIAHVWRAEERVSAEPFESLELPLEVLWAR